MFTENSDNNMCLTPHFKVVNEVKMIWEIAEKKNSIKNELFISGFCIISESKNIQKKGHDKEKLGLCNNCFVSRWIFHI